LILVQGAGEAQVRVAYLPPDAPNADVYVNGELALTILPYTTVSDCLALPAGTQHVTFYADSLDVLLVQDDASTGTTASARASASASATVSPSASARPLPDAGGSTWLPLPAALALVVSGVVASSIRLDK